MQLLASVAVLILLLVMAILAVAITLSLLFEFFDGMSAARHLSGRKTRLERDSDWAHSLGEKWGSR